MQTFKENVDDVKLIRVLNYYTLNFSSTASEKGFGEHERHYQRDRNGSLAQGECETRKRQIQDPERDSQRQHKKTCRPV